MVIPASHHPLLWNKYCCSPSFLSRFENIAPRLIHCVVRLWKALSAAFLLLEIIWETSRKNCHSPLELLCVAFSNNRWYPIQHSRRHSAAERQAQLLYTLQATALLSPRLSTSNTSYSDIHIFLGQSLGHRQPPTATQPHEHLHFKPPGNGFKPRALSIYHISQPPQFTRIDTSSRQNHFQTVPSLTTTQIKPTQSTTLTTQLPQSCPEVADQVTTFPSPLVLVRRRSPHPILVVVLRKAVVVVGMVVVMGGIRRRVPVAAEAEVMVGMVQSENCRKKR